MDRNMPKVKAVRLNQLGLERLNGERDLAGKSRLALLPAAFGQEALPAGSDSAQTKDLLGGGGPVPAAVDNSMLPCFPPVRSQGSIGSCASFSTTYYVGTHMLGLARGWNNRNDDNSIKLSPKWTYPMVNNGQDGGSWFGPTIEVLLKHGGATWADWPYSGVDTPASFREWCRNGDVWRRSANYRMDQSGTITDVETDTGMNNVKALLADGYIMLYATDVYGWQFGAVADDPATTADNPYVGQAICLYVQGQASGHAMTVVGYNDHLWVDINKNGVVDAGEKGAFRIVNSWGTSWQDQGFAWLSYDALRAVSAVAGVFDQFNRAPGSLGAGRTPWWYNEVYYYTARSSWTPRLLAQFTLSSAARSDVRVTLGVSATTSSTPTSSWTAGALQQQGGRYGFDGTATALPGTFTFDLTDLATNGPRRYHLAVADAVSGSPVTVSDFRLLDPNGATLAVAALPGGSLTADNSTIRAYLDYTLGSLAITSATSATGRVGTAFSFTVTAPGATSFGAVSLPPGLSINPNTGVISGSPTSAGSYVASLTVNSSTGSGSGVLNLTIVPAAMPAPGITSANAVTGRVGLAFSYQITASNNPTSCGANSLPPGLSVNNASGLISGTPTAAGTYLVEVSAANSGGTGIRGVTLVIEQPLASVPVITSPNLASTPAGSPFTYRITASNNPTLFGADNLPSGLAVTGSSGLIAGTLSAAQQYGITLWASNAAGKGYGALTLSVLGDALKPANDDFENRATLVGTNLSIQANNANATAQVGEPAHAGYPAARSVWWEWLAPYGGTVILSTPGSDFDTVLAVYAGADLARLALVASDDEGGTNHTSRLTFQAAAGVTYRIAVDGYAGASGLISLSLSLSGAASAPANDNFAGAFVLVGSSIATNGLNVGATPQAGEPAHAGAAASRSVWYVWNPPATGPARVSTAGSSFDTVLGIYTGTSVNGLTPVASDDQSGGNNTSLAQFNAVAGTTYRIAVDGFQGAQGSVSLNIQFLGGTAGNDNFANRSTLTGSSVTVTAYNTHATAELGEPAHAGNIPARSLWWTWTAPVSATLAINTVGSSFDTVLALYIGTTLSSLTEVASNDDGGSNLTSQVLLPTMAGVTYQIAVDGYGGKTGQVVLNIRPLPAAPANDAFASSYPLGGFNFQTNAHNYGATAEANEPFHDGYVPRRSVWFHWVAPRTGPVSITTDGSSCDTVLAVYVGSTLASLFPVASNDDANDLRTSTVQFDAIAGYRYRIAVDGYDGVAGEIVLAGFMDTNDTTLMFANFENVDLGADALMNSTYDWLGINTSYGAEGTIDYALAGETRSAYLGFLWPALLTNYVAIYRPLNIDPVAEGRPLLGVVFDVAIRDSSNFAYDDFCFTFYNSNGQILARLVFNNQNNTVLYDNRQGSLHDTGFTYVNNRKYSLLLLINLASNTWSAWMDDTAIISGAAFNSNGRNRDIADVDFEWLISDTYNPGNNALIFDNFYLVAMEQPAPPLITAEPLSLTLPIGGIGSFRVDISGSHPLACQWYMASQPLAGATNSALYLVNVATNQAADYRMVVTNEYGRATSQWARLTVVVPPPSARMLRPLHSDRGLQFQITGPAGRSYKVDASSNLLQWLELQTILNQNGTVMFLDSAATNLPRRFYRLRED